MSDYISLKDVSKAFGAKLAVDRVGFGVKKGEVLGFLGPNGAGKTTTMRMLVGALRATDGEIRVCGFSLKEQRREAQARIGYLPEGAPLYPELSPRSFLEFVGRARGLTGAALKGRIEYVEDQLHLQEVAFQAIDTLSKGYRRRVGLAQAILHDPEALVLDEPTDGLDPVQKHDVREMIARLSRDKAIVISTHILEEVAAVCTRAAIIARGRILFDDSPAVFIGRHPHHGAVRVDLSQGASEAGIAETLAALEGVRRVERGEEDKHTEYWVYAENAAKAVSAVAGAAHAHGWALNGIAVESGSPDEVFRDIVAAA
jgi:ABC-2 type transport system ATP-binding protein